MFEIFTSCGGDVGKMLAHESMKREQVHEDVDGDAWFTRDDLMKKYHNKSDKVDNLIQRKIKEGKVRPHKEFPEDPEMREYKGYDKTTSTSTDSRAYARGMSWKANVEGQVALDLAQNAPTMFMPADSEESTGTNNLPPPPKPSKAKKSRGKNR